MWEVWGKVDRMLRVVVFVVVVCVMSLLPFATFSKRIYVDLGNGGLTGEMEVEVFLKWKLCSWEREKETGLEMFMRGRGYRRSGCRRIVRVESAGVLFQRHIELRPDLVMGFGWVRFLASKPPYAVYLYLKERERGEPDLARRIGDFFASWAKGKKKWRRWEELNKLANGYREWEKKWLGEEAVEDG